MGLSSLPTASIRSVDATSARVTNLALPWADVARRSDELAFGRSQACGYVNGPIESQTLSAAGTYDLGVFLLPPIGNSTNVVTAYVYISAYSTGNTSYYAEIVEVVDGEVLSERPVPRPERKLIGTASAVGWLSADITIPAGTPFLAQYALRIVAIATATTSQTVGAVQVLTKFESTMRDGSTAPTTWEKLSLTHMGTEDRPDSVGALRVLKRQQDLVAAKYPRTLAAHSYEIARVQRNATLLSDSQAVTTRYKVQRGPNTGNCTLYIYAQQDAESVTAGNGAIDVYVNDDTSSGSAAVSASLSGTSAAWYTLTVPSGSWTANSVHDLKIRTYAAYTTDHPGVVTVYAIVLVENAYSSSDYVVGAESAPTTWTPARFSTPVAGTPIVADYAGGSLTGKLTDRLRLAKNALMAGYRKHAILLEDYLWRDTTSSSTASTYYLNGTTAAWGSAASLFRTKRTPTYGTAYLEIWANVRRNGTANGDRVPKFGVWVDGTAQATLETIPANWTGGFGYEPAQSQISRRWMRVGILEVTPAATYEIEIRGGWVDQYRESVGSNTDAAVLEGVRILEIPEQARP